ncbi:N(2),N(2)-dimethylguanosine tRNA methyltransferase [Plasmodium gonderi]|uniref:tRNA (guanine(26)-N(2))-dimethyltransferase n=1 Tax=Plasmodium gonderi TaxID=77519 RepID=A0A1Y1JMD7_PLAGO|nr:N(2),N(2)-dimethylguanosine tRNA methyltransferase [Plasmodium gonderi]GAW83400.1 N(2),N(2)-dimethylguanosine tRNA methyltransferase [Plasmodium gonderi]
MIGAKNEIKKNYKRKRNYVEENKHNFYKKCNNGTNKTNVMENTNKENGGEAYSCNLNNKYIFEGSVKIKNKSNNIFYNKVQVFNRDMSIILIKALEIYLKNKNKDKEKILFRGFNVVELLSASGIRSIRYVKELQETINHIIANDIDKYACKQIRRNFKRNQINKEKYTILCNDANSVMNILNIDNIYGKKRSNKKLDIGFSYINNTTDYNDYFREALKFLKYLTNYNRVKSDDVREEKPNNSIDNNRVYTNDANNETNMNHNNDTNMDHNNDTNMDYNNDTNMDYNNDTNMDYNNDTLNDRNNKNKKSANNNYVEDHDHLQESDSTAFSSSDETVTNIDASNEAYNKTENSSYTRVNNAYLAVGGNEPIDRETKNEINQIEKIQNTGVTQNIGDKNNLSERQMEEIIKNNKIMEKYMFDIIDIDPYGSSLEYLESCLKYGRSNFFILITNTDMRVLNGKFPDVSFYKYNSMIFSQKVNYNKEYCIRVLFYKIKTIAAKYKKCVIPYSSLNIDFYIRILIQVLDDALQTKDLCIDSGLVYQCNNCCSFYINPMASKKDVNLSDIENNKHSKKRRRNKRNAIFSNAKKNNHTFEETGHGPAELNTLNDHEHNHESENMTVEYIEDDVVDDGTTENVENGNNIDKLVHDDIVEKEENFKKSLNGEYPDNKRNSVNIEFTQNAGDVNADIVSAIAERPFQKEEYEKDENPIICHRYKCSKLNISNKCMECGGDILLGGPIYIGKLHNDDFIHTCISLLENLEEYNLNTIKSRERILINFRCLKQEINVPLYYNLPSLFRNFKICSFSRRLLVNALLNLNYQVSYFHKDPDSVKTNAPNSVFMDIFRAIIYKINSKKRKSNTVEPGKDEINSQNNNNEGTEDRSKKIYSINTIKDEKLREKLLSYEFFKKNSAFDNIDISNYKKNDNVHMKLFTLQNPEPFWGPMKKHHEKN